MLFNSIEFGIFLPIVFIIYWFIVNKNLKFQNFFLLITSYFFYAWWDWRFLSLIIFSSFVDYFVGIGLSRTTVVSKRKLLLYVSIFVNLGFLGVLKYFNFFIQNFADVFTLMGRSLDVSRLSIILPVGISFYTFQTLSYSIDVYKKKIEPTKDLLAFFAFVSFFPQLVAGPIERATNLLPQFYKKRYFNYDFAVSGIKLILWGLFKKIVIADNCSIYVDDIFNNIDSYSGGTLILGAVLFAFQIYGDFSGYSDIAIGTGRLFGFRFLDNFKTPYFSRDIAEFWRRWHISLSTWFRDYLYIPLGGSKGGKWLSIRNIFIIFIVSGFWHGANWTFIFWGGLNAIYFLPLFLLKKNRVNKDVVAHDNYLPSVRELFQMLFTFGLTTFAWIFFRANNLSDAFNYINRITIAKDFFSIHTSQTYIHNIKPLIIYILFVILIEWFKRDRFNLTIFIRNSNARYILLFLFYFLLVLLIIISIKNKTASFIYFQF